MSLVCGILNRLLWCRLPTVIMFPVCLLTLSTVMKWTLVPLVHRNRCVSPCGLSRTLAVTLVRCSLPVRLMQRGRLVLLSRVISIVIESLVILTSLVLCSR